MEATAYRCLRSSDSYQGKSLFTQPEPITLKTCRSEGWGETIKLPDEPRGSRRGERAMRENLSSMALPHSLAPTDLLADKKGMK